MMPKLRGQKGSALIEYSIPIAIFVIIVAPSLITLSDRINERFCATISQGFHSDYNAFYSPTEKKCKMHLGWNAGSWF